MDDCDVPTMDWNETVGTEWTLWICGSGDGENGWTVSIYCRKYAFGESRMRKRSFYMTLDRERMQCDAVLTMNSNVSQLCIARVLI